MAHTHEVIEDTFTLTEYREGQVGVVRKGQIAKTTFLVGCFAPVVQYEEMIILGHFSWRNISEVHKQLAKHAPFLKRSTSVDIYRIDTETSNAWRENDSSYVYYLDQMKDVLAQATHMKKAYIRTPSYPVDSVVVVDWRDDDAPKIFTEPA